MAKRELESGVPGKSVSAGASVEDEPGHKGEEAKPGDVFDPNAAWRAEQGFGPGLQDSERFQPAHWVQPGEIAAAEEARLERKVEAAQRDLDELKEAQKEAGFGSASASSNKPVAPVNK